MRRHSPSLSAMLTIDHSPVSSSPQVLGETLLDYQNDGFSLEQFLEFFPSVRREDAEEFLQLVQAGRA